MVLRFSPLDRERERGYCFYMKKQRSEPKEASLEPLARILARLEDPSQVKRLLESLLTSTEQREIASRWQLVQLLAKGVSQREIASMLGVSLCKITRGSRELKGEDSPLRLALALEGGEDGLS
ncbi:MAG: Trp operon repressor [Candidatus Aminicenantes bacterium ADurb.Bin508]|nr:MAG: Trp operon repressor [Candidatus Aminicenantes bacterium ADurb.Bin508]